MRRIKLCTTAPLPSLKAWYPIKDSVETIYQLKYNLVHDLATLVKGGHRRSDIGLQIDGFDLLDGSSISILNLESDVLHIKLNESGGDVGRKKRKLSESSKPAKKRKIEAKIDNTAHKRDVSDKRGRPATIHPGRDKVEVAAYTQHEERPAKRHVFASSMSQPSSSSSSSSSSTSSSSSSTSSEYTSSDSDSSSESSTNTDKSSKVARQSSPVKAAERGRAFKPTVPRAQIHALSSGRTAALEPFPAGRDNGSSNAPLKFAGSSTASNVTSIDDNVSYSATPPGNGKKSTRERNLRRRASRKAQKSASIAPERPNPSAIPVTSPMRLREEVLSVASSSPVPRAMANKNKRKGFLRAMDGAIGKRTVYPDSVGDVVPTQYPCLAPTATEQSSTSERKSTTTQPLATGLDGAAFSSGSPMRLPPLPPSRMNTLSPNLIVKSKWFTIPSRQEAMKEIKKEAQLLAAARSELKPHQTEPVVSVDLASPSGWNESVKKFEHFVVITTENAGKLQEHDLVAWKSLQLNEETWRPEMQVQFGRVFVKDDNSVTIKPLSQPQELPLENDTEDEAKARAAAVGSSEDESDLVLTLQALCQGDYRVI